MDGAAGSRQGRLVLSVLFAEGAACLAGAFAVVVSRWPDPNGEAYNPVIFTLIGGLVVSTLVATLVLGFPALTILSIGVLTGIVGLLLLGFSLGKLYSQRSAGPAGSRRPGITS